LPRRFAQLELVGHFLEAGSKSFNPLLLARGFAVLIKAEEPPRCEV